MHNVIQKFIKSVATGNPKYVVGKQVNVNKDKINTVHGIKALIVVVVMSCVIQTLEKQCKNISLNFFTGMS